MSREIWNVIKSKKSFHVKIYRQALTWLVLALIFNCVFGFFLFALKLNLPERVYYATDGITPPVRLQALAARNETSQALLGSDESLPAAPKTIPQ